MNKGILLWTEVVCASCGATTAGKFVRHGRRQMRVVKADLLKHGWIIRHGAPFCPECIFGVQAHTIELPTSFKGAK